MCKADSVALDEACFQRHALRFDGSTSLRWGGPNGFRENITNNFVTDFAPKDGLVGELFKGITVVPKGSMWAQNPVRLTTPTATVSLLQLASLSPHARLDFSSFWHCSFAALSPVVKQLTQRPLSASDVSCNVTLTDTRPTILGRPGDVFATL